MSSKNILETLGIVCYFQQPSWIIINFQDTNIVDLGYLKSAKTFR